MPTLQSGSPSEELVYAFHFTDTNKDGYITANEITVDPNVSFTGYSSPRDIASVSNGFDLFSRKIRINSLNAGMVETEGFHAAGIAESDFRKQVEAQTPLGRIGQPSDIASVAVFLASADSGWVTGQTLVVSGGNR